MRLGAQEGDAELAIFLRIHALIREGVQERQRVAGYDVNDGGAQVLHEEDLALAVSRRRGQDQGPQALGAVMEAQAAGEEPVAHHVLEDVGCPHAGGVHGPGEKLRPAVDILSRVEYHRDPARGARG